MYYKFNDSTNKDKIPHRDSISLGTKKNANRLKKETVRNLLVVK